MQPCDIGTDCDNRIPSGHNLTHTRGSLYPHYHPLRSRPPDHRLPSTSQQSARGSLGSTRIKGTEYQAAMIGTPSSSVFVGQNDGIWDGRDFPVLPTGSIQSSPAVCWLSTSVGSHSSSLQFRSGNTSHNAELRNDAPINLQAALESCGRLMLSLRSITSLIFNIRRLITIVERTRFKTPNE